MRKRWPRSCFFIATLGILIFVTSNDSNGEGGVNHYQKNLRYLSWGGFQRNIRPHGETVENTKIYLEIPDLKWRVEQMKLWKSAIKEAVTILPPKFVKKLGRLRFTFYVDRYTWETAHPSGNTVYVNLLPSVKRPEWMTWEPWPSDGFTREEMIFIALHEMAHIYSIGEELDQLYYYQYSGMAWWNDSHLEAISSIHCSSFYPSLDDDVRVISGHVYYGGQSFDVGKAVDHCHVHDFGVHDYENSFPFGGWPTLYGHVRGRNEDFADTFALYVMFPEYLEKNFPFRRDIIKSILAREYVTRYPMSGSIPSHLSRTIKDTDKVSGGDK